MSDELTADAGGNDDVAATSDADFGLPSLEDSAAGLVAKSAPAADPSAPPVEATTISATPAAAPAPAPSVSSGQPPLPDALEARLAEFVDRQASARRESEESKARTAKLEADLAAERQSKAELIARLKRDPVKLLNDEGWDLEALNRSVLQGGTPEGVRVRQLEARLEELTSNLAAERTQREQREAAERSAGETAAIKRGVEQAIAAKRGEHTHLHALLEPGEVVDAVYDLMARTHRESGGTKRLDPVGAAEVLESQLRERAKRLQPATSSTPAPTTATPSPTPTLTGRATPARSESEDDLSDAELNRRAALAFEAASAAKRAARK